MLQAESKVKKTNEARKEEELPADEDVCVEEDIKMSGCELWGQEAACVHVFRPTQALQWVIYMDGRLIF